jgi:hypothetical protein
MVLRLHKRRNLTGHPVAEGGPMIKMRLLVSVPLFAAMILSSACVTDGEEPELDTAEVDRGAIALYAPGPEGQGGQWFEKGYLVLHTGYSEGAGWAQFRIYTEESGVWAEPFIQSLCTDGNWVDARGEQFVGPGSWMFLEADCPAPYSVSEAWVSIGLDY